MTNTHTHTHTRTHSILSSLFSLHGKRMVITEASNRSRMEAGATPDSWLASGSEWCALPHRTDHLEHVHPEPPGPTRSSVVIAVGRAGRGPSRPFVCFADRLPSILCSFPTSLSLFLILLACASHLETTAKCWPSCQVKIILRVPAHS